MLVEEQLTKHQVRDPRTSRSTECSSSFVDPSFKLGLLLLCILPFYLPGKIQALIGQFSNWLFRHWMLLTGNKLVDWIFPVHLENYLIMEWIRFRHFWFRHQEIGHFHHNGLMKWYINYIILIYYYDICQPRILPALNCWKDHKTVAMTLLCGEEPLLLLRRVSELLIVFAISKDHE